LRLRLRLRARLRPGLRLGLRLRARLGPGLRLRLRLRARLGPGLRLRLRLRARLRPGLRLRLRRRALLRRHGGRIEDGVVHHGERIDDARGQVTHESGFGARVDGHRGQQDSQYDALRIHLSHPPHIFVPRRNGRVKIKKPEERTRGRAPLATPD
jgi:hypothetical protein